MQNDRGGLKNTPNLANILCTIATHMNMVYLPWGTLGARVVTGRPLRFSSNSGRRTFVGSGNRGLWLTPSAHCTERSVLPLPELAIGIAAALLLRTRSPSTAKAIP